ncbi:MAG: hypothetical protein GXC73_20740 [Chitinophagaceae bacterium]|nr:hypothetical protein [Chitinophagaceae bacterium]
MSRSKKVLIGLLAFLPLAASAIFLVYFFAGIFPEILRMEHEQGDVTPEFFFGNMMGFIAGVIILTFVQLGLMIYFIIHAINNKRVKNEERIIWVLLFILVSTISFPIYWGIRIWPEEKPESNFVKM